MKLVYSDKFLERNSVSEYTGFWITWCKKLRYVVKRMKLSVELHSELNYKAIGLDMFYCMSKTYSLFTVFILIIMHN